MLSRQGGDRHRTLQRPIRRPLPREGRPTWQGPQELQRRAKEQAKLSALEQARLEVETYENRIDVLLSVHKEQGDH